MASAFYLRLAFSNLRRSRVLYLPYVLATAIISGVYFVICAMLNSPGLNSVPTGQTAQMLIRDESERDILYNRSSVQTRSDIVPLTHTLLLNQSEVEQLIVFNLNTTQEEGLDFLADAQNAMYDLDKSGAEHPYVTPEIRANISSRNLHCSSSYIMRLEGFGIYGGLLFMGAFFGILFLALTVLIIYFKQVTEGYEDKERFVILQQVGMDDKQVRSAINRQVLWVFFLPLGAAFCHLCFSTPLVIRMLQCFQLNTPRVTINCTLISAALFAVVYVIVYRLTARVYYRIVAK